MITLHLLIACDLGFALFIWWAYRDHNRKMDALYEKYDKEARKRWGDTLDETEVIQMSDNN